jgi:tetratricopeptide (TPR) repeat protein
MDGVASLLDKSLLRQEGQVDNEPRFVMLEMIREFALDRLDAAGETEELGRSHAAYFQRVAEAAQPELEKESQAIWLARLDAEYANIRAALGWSIRQKDWKLGAGLGIPLGIFWFMRGYLTEGRNWLEQILALEGLSQNQKVNADVLDRAGFLASYQGGYLAAARLIDACLTLRRSLGDRHRIGDSLALLGFVRLRQGNYEQALILNQEALEIHREINNGQGIADALSNLGIIAFHQGDLISAQAMCAECLEIWEKLGDPQGVAWASHLLGKGNIQLGEYQKAQINFLQSLTLAEKLGYQWGLAFSFEGLASLAAAQARWERALVLAGGAALIRHSIGMPLTAADQRIYNRTLLPAYKNLTKEEAAAAYQLGQAMPPEQLVQYAVDLNSPAEN